MRIKVIAKLIKKNVSIKLKNPIYYSFTKYIKNQNAKKSKTHL